MRDCIKHLWQLGPHVILELLIEIGEKNKCVIDVANCLSAYRQLTPTMLRLTGADRLAPRRLLLVPEMGIPAGGEL